MTWQDFIILPAFLNLGHKEGNTGGILFFGLPNFN